MSQVLTQYVILNFFMSVKVSWKYSPNSAEDTEAYCTYEQIALFYPEELATCSTVLQRHCEGHVITCYQSC